MRELRLHVNGDQFSENIRQLVRDTLRQAAGGQCPVTLAYKQSRGQAHVRLGEAWKVQPSDGLLEALRGAVGAEAVELVYE